MDVKSHRLDAALARKTWELLTRSERRGALGLLGLMIIGMVLETLGVGLVVPAVALLAQADYAENNRAIAALMQRLGSPDRVTLIVWAMLLLTALFLVKNVFLAFLTWRQMRFAFNVQAGMSERLFHCYLQQPYVFHLQRNSAQLLRNVISDVSLFTQSGMMPALMLLSELLVLVGICGLLMIVEPLGALIVIAVLSGAGWSFLQLTRKRIARWGVVRQHHDGLRIQHVQQGLGGVKDVKLLGREFAFLEQYRLHNLHSARVGQLQMTLLQLPRLWLEMLAIGGLAMLVFTMVARDRSIDSILPILGLFAAAAFRLMPSANRVISAAQALRFGVPVIETLSAELKATATMDAEPASRAVARAAPFTGPLALERVTFTYPGAARAALADVSMATKAGEAVGFIGSSGAGKSTLIDVLLGLLTPDGGVVRVAGCDIRGDLRAWQDQIGYVPQAIYLTDDTLRRNVAFGISDDKIDDAAVWRALCAAQLDEFVRSLPEGVATMVGERGIRLSGGQRQRIGIARALYHDPAVLVLDEATSSLDTATEKGVMQAVRALHGAKTVIIVAHRMSTVEYCDRLYRLQHGQIVEEGTPLTMLPQRQSG